MVTTLLLSACTASGPVVTYQESIPSFSAYRTFDFAQPLTTDHGDGRSDLSEHLMTYTARELEPRGFQRNPNEPDLIVDFNALVSDNVPKSGDTQFGAVIVRGRYWGPGYRGPGHWGPGRWGPGYWGPGMTAGAGGGVSTSGISITTKGTLFIRIIERERQRVVWDGSTTERVTDKTMNNLEPFVETAVADMFVKFPATLPR